MVKGILFSLICVHVQVPVRSQTADPLTCEALSAFELSVLVLLALICLFCTIAVTGVLILFRKLDKWDTEATPTPATPTAATPTYSQAPTRVSSLRLPPDPKQESAQSQGTPCPCQSPVRSACPPDYAHTMSRLARTSRVPAAAGRGLCGDSHSHYMEMKSLTIAALSSSLGESSIYDTPHYSRGLLRSVSSTPASLTGPKHSRFHSDPSSCPAPSAGPVRAAAHSGTPEPLSQSTANSRPGSITHQTS
ncbi:hypothetical protein AAFF_G00338410 [Aldrovandia affinis]|uniref:Uncharacterized protein n=1 Tax=Aldrovandia affinis TaxID=143900 RepID=A0AAD7R6M2_9TELE|nr:hypothetical protein AAFF_G00338410 [Aldrovandia affinis]